MIMVSLVWIVITMVPGAISITPFLGIGGQDREPRFRGALGLCGGGTTDPSETPKSSPQALGLALPLEVCHGRAHLLVVQTMSTLSRQVHERTKRDAVGVPSE